MAIITESELRAEAESLLGGIPPSHSRRFSRSSAGRSVFVSHSSQDRDLVLLVKTLLEHQGTSVYVDWLDDGLPSVVDRQTASILKTRIASNSLFLLIATARSLSSRWVPWELGIADGLKGMGAIAVLPVQRPQDTYSGNEYVGMYAELCTTDLARFSALAQPRPPGTPSVSMKEWLSHRVVIL